MNENLVMTSAGKVEKRGDIWYFNYTMNSDDIEDIPFTDHWTIDTLIVRHNGKFGIYTLPGLSDYGNDGSLEWISLDEAPFPYDEIHVLGMNAAYWGFIAYRIGDKWGINRAFYSPTGYCIKFTEAVPCEYLSVGEAIDQLPTWRTPFII